MKTIAIKGFTKMPPCCDKCPFVYALDDIDFRTDLVCLALAARYISDTPSFFSAILC